MFSTGSIFNWTIFSKRWSIIIFSVIVVIFALMYGSLFESTATEFSEITDSLPPEIASILGDLSNSSTPEGWINLEFYSLTFPIMIGILAIIAGASMIGKDEEDATLELYLASPISRTKIFVEKYLAMLAQLLLISLAAILGVWLSKELYPPFDVNLTKVFWATFSTFLFSLSFASFTAMVQSLSKSKSIANYAGTATFILGYIAILVYRLSDSFDWIRFLSPFYYLNTEDIFFKEIELLYFGVFISLITIFFTVGLITFRKRDTGV